MSKRPRGTAAYAEVIGLMDTAIVHENPFVFACASESIAINTVHRMNQWRMIDRENDPLGQSNSKYDQFIFRRTGRFITIDRRPEIVAVEAWIVNEDGTRTPVPLHTIQRRETVAEIQHDLDTHDYTQPSNDPEVEWVVAVNRYELRRFMKARQAGFTGEQITADQSILNQFGPPCDRAPELSDAFKRAGKPWGAPYDPNGPAPKVVFEIADGDQ